ncbi:cell division protein FtsK [Lentzea tibetensis]|uniref:Cell division protein FtsK n=1 Tax=Lentzea tibetensis TaxID=2591470 RepID=A0A563EV94_9PSEU|nr:FtsK/SpoIIIE domain-containing protein [Lentzea tibetensis]TWP51468.1 cell division protein FtsK [Lentzea tibetensis]
MTTTENHPTPAESTGGDASVTDNVVHLRPQPAPEQQLDADPRAEIEVAPPVIDAELVDETGAGDVTGSVTLVDQPGGDSVHWVRRLRETERLPIVPDYLKTAQEARATAVWVGKHYAHTTAYHGVRVPLYALKLAVRSPLGALMLAAATGRWVLDMEGRPVRSGAAMRQDAEMYLKLSHQRDARVRTRLIVTGAVLVAVTVGVIVLMSVPDLVPSWILWAGGALMAAALGKYGTPADQPVTSRAVVGAQLQKLTSDVVEKALMVLGIAGINQAMSKNARAIGFTAPITRDGPGWRAEVDLPAGVTAAEVLDKRDKLASGLGRPLGCVWPEGRPDVHPGRLVLWVGDQDMSKARQPAWALRKGEKIDLFKPQPFGTDVRGGWVSLTLMYVAGIIGAVPRMGKTFTLRELLLIAAMDPRSELHTFDLKGTGDLSPLEPVSYRYRAGDDPEDLEYALADLRALRDEMRRRTKVIRELPKDLCPESKVTTELASKKSLGLHPVVVGVDECQVWFEHPDYGKEFEEICTDLVKRGPATGIVLVLATQRPDSKSIPTPISDNAILRFCLKVAGQVPNDMVLGTSSYRNGERATTFSFTDKGIGLLKGVTDETKTVKCVYIDAPSAEKIVARCRAVRVTAGRLTGYAAGLDAAVDDVEAADTLLSDLLNVFGSRDKAWSESLVDALVELRPAAYAAWGELSNGAAKATQLAAALKPFSISTKQVWGTDPATGKGANRMGVERTHIADALTERDGKRKRG